MRIGTAGFVPARLTEAREARGLAQTDLACLTGIKSQSISHYEQGRQSPSPEALSILCEKLRLPERFFLRPVRDCPGGPIFFRSPRPSSRVARAQAERRLSWLRDVAAYVREYVDLPVVRLPAFRSDTIEEAAEGARGFFAAGTGPVSNVALLLENHGCIATWSESPEARGDSCSRWFEGVPYIALARPELSPGHTDLAAAHELGHLVLHSQLTERDLRDAGTHRILERHADYFARAFLLPANTFGREVWAPNIDALLALQREWKCPVPAMVLRCGDLGIFSRDQVRRAFTNMRRRGWKAGEPRARKETSVEPQLLARAIRLLIESGATDYHSMVTRIGLNTADIEDLANLPSGYLRNRAAPAAFAPSLRQSVAV